MNERHRVILALIIWFAGLTGAAVGARANTAWQNGQFLSTSGAWGVDLVRTARSMQTHVRIASLKQVKDIGPELQQRGFSLVKVVEGKRGSAARAYVAWRARDLIIAFRGSKGSNVAQTLSNAATDLNAFKKKLKWVDASARRAKALKKIKVHRGFNQEYERLRGALLAAVNRHPKKRIFVTGHSLGGALAVLCALDIKAHTGRTVTLYTSGAPRVGGGDFRAIFEQMVPGSVRVVMSKDLVPRIPGLALDYQHTGGLLTLRPDGRVVPPSKIDTVIRRGTWSAHDYGVYRKALDGLLERCVEGEGLCARRNNPLQTSARAERQAR